MDSMNTRELTISGADLIEIPTYKDERGSLKKLFEKASLKNKLDEMNIIDINLSTTKTKGTVRGMHFQYSPYAEKKFIQCLQGSVWDVIVDLRSNSPTYLKWDAVELNSSDSRMIIVPEGVAHGFQSLADDSQLLYFHTQAYSKEFESGLRFDDPALEIQWPLEVTKVSERDLSHALIEERDFDGMFQ